MFSRTIFPHSALSGCQCPHASATSSFTSRHASFTSFSYLTAIQPEYTACIFDVNYLKGKNIQVKLKIDTLRGTLMQNTAKSACR